MFLWTAEKMQLLRQAGEHTAFYRTLAAAAAPYLSPAGHVADVGCGLGYLSRELSHYVNHVTAIESDDAALDVLRQDCPKNVTPLCVDAFAYAPEEPFDDMVFCFFGHIADAVEIAAKYCRGKVLVFTKNYPEHRFSAGHHPIEGHGFPSFCTWLEETGIPYESDSLEVEFDQPFRSLEQARRFYALYCQAGDEPLFTDDFLLHKLVSTDDPDFPLCLPHVRQVGFLRLDADEIRKKL